MSSVVTTATITASMSSPSATAAIGFAALILLLIFLFEKEILVSSVRPDILAATRYLNVVIVPLLLACGLIATVRLAIAVGIIH